MQIGMANTAELHIDENFIWPGLPHIDLLVLNGSAGLLEDLGPLLRRDFRHDRTLQRWICLWTSVNK